MMRYNVGMNNIFSNISKYIFFVDFDDTLIEPQPDPTCFRMPEDLLKLAESVAEKKSLSVVIVTGRSVEQIDTFFSPFYLPVIGCHGGQVRLDSKEMAKNLLEPMPNDFSGGILSICKNYTNPLIENKKYSFAIHPFSAEYKAIKKDLDAFVEKWVAYKVFPYGSCLEVRHNGITKGKAIQALMSEFPDFSGKKAIYIGDDVGKDASLDLLKKNGAMLIPVGKTFKSMGCVFETPQIVRAFLKSAMKHPVAAKNLGPEF